MLGTMAIGIAFMGCMAMFGFFFPGQSESVFQKSPEVIRIGTFGLRAASIGSMVMPVSVCANMLYQSIRQAGKASFLSMLRSGLAMIPALIVLSNAFGLKGILSAQPVADVISSLICVPFILHFIFKTPNTEKKA
ncbi:MAG: MATE family efflux transporter, partial [Clostridia bacterium]|nr:MATE family efflux transporter [Clostridia bacterium]